MKSYVLSFLMICVAQANLLANVFSNTAAFPHGFGNFSQEYKKQYSSTNELKFRETVFSKNVKQIDKLNQNPNNTYPQGITYYSDFTPDQFKALILNKNLFLTPELLITYPDWNQTTRNGIVLTTIEQKVKKQYSEKTKKEAIRMAKQNDKKQLLNNKQILTVKASGFALPSKSKPATNLTTKSNNKSTTASTINLNQTNLRPQNNNSKSNESYSINGGFSSNSQAISAKSNTSEKVGANMNFLDSIFDVFLPKQMNNLPKEQKWKAPSGAQKSVDWRNGLRVSHVKMQGACGNCYSFSTTGALESAFMIKNNQTNISFSDQQITDCCGIGGFGCNGCEGGWQWQALRYILKDGIVTEQQYKTISSETGQIGKCQKVISPRRILDDKTPFVAIQPGNLTLLYQAVSKQPVSVGVDSSNMQFVMSEDSTAIFSNCSSKPQDANHAMLVVEYDTSGNWILKNSWSEYWGDKGYIKIKAGNTCGIANFALYPNVIQTIKAK